MSRRRGNVNENQFMETAEKLGYATFAARGSRGEVDVLCFHDQAVYKPTQHYDLHRNEYYDVPRPLKPIVVQVGTAGKPISSTLAALQQAPRPIGSLCIVARKIRAKNRRISWKYHTLAGTFSTLQEAIEAKADV